MSVPLPQQRVLRADTGCCPPYYWEHKQPTNKGPVTQPRPLSSPRGAASHLHQGTANWEPTAAPPSLVAQTVKNSPAVQKTWVWSLDWKILWRRTWQHTPVFLPGESPWTEEPGGIQSIESQRVWHNTWDNIKQGNLHITGIPKGEEREKGIENIFKKLWLKTSQT